MWRGRRCERPRRKHVYLHRQPPRISQKGHTVLPVSGVHRDLGDAHAGSPCSDCSRYFRRAAPDLHCCFCACLSHPQFFFRSVVALGF
jgi:hypothetical protein